MFYTRVCSLDVFFCRPIGVQCMVSHLMGMDVISVAPEMEPGLRVTGQRVIGAGSGRVTGQSPDPAV